MAEMSHRLLELEAQKRGSRYARMIPGAAGAPAGAPAQPLPVFDRADGSSRRILQRSPRGAVRSGWLHLLLPHINTRDQFGLFQLAAPDLLVLLACCLLPSIALPAWSLPPLATPAYAVLFLLLAFSEGLYSDVADTAEQELPILIRSSLCAMILVLVAEWNDTQPIAALTCSATSVAGLAFWRQTRSKWWNRHFRPAEPRNVLIVGASPTARAVARALRNDPYHAANVVGFLDDHAPLSPQVLGRIGDLDWLARAQFIDEVILAVPDDPALLREAAEVALRNHLDIRAVPNLPPGFWPDAGVERIGGAPVITLHREALPCVTLLLKRCLDVTGASVGLTLIAPVMGLLALLVRLDSPGPVFYVAERSGAKGRPFRCYKFRSMTTGADQMKESLRGRNQREGPIFKIDGDPRITRFGRFLRRYSLDELPQLWNVLRGDMSLVGPRPHPVEEVNHYQLHHYRRLDMKPGMTGLWQITARSSPSFELNLHLDLTYIENWNLALDLRILMSTIPVLFAPEGA